MRNFSRAAILLLFLFPACGKNIRLPRPDTTQEGEVFSHKKEAEEVNVYLGRIEKLEREQDKLKQSALEKRENGYNTKEAEEVLAAVDEAVKIAKALLLERKFEELGIKVNETKSLQKKVKNLIKKAPAFGDRPIKKEKIERKYLDDRDWVLENRKREPDKKEYRYSTTVRLFITDASAVLQQCRCWDPRMNQFVLDNPPIMESWYYLEDKTIYIFSEDNSVFRQFLLRNDLPPQNRDALLAELCEKQANLGGLKLIYVGPPVADLSSIMEQALTGRMRFAGMFGIENMERIARATAALPDLSVASVAFNTAIDGLNKLQAEQFDKFYELVKILDPEKKHPEVFGRIFSWQRTLKPSEKDIKELVKLFPEKETDIKELLTPFKESLLQLAKEFGIVRDKLVKFKIDFDEMVFEEGKSISAWFFLEGASFQEKVLPDGQKVEMPDLSVKVKVEFRPGKKSPPVPVGEFPEIKIGNANKFIDEVREYRRLASFGLRFPTMLYAGSYLITFEISDNLRAQTTTYSTNWLIRPQEQ